MDDAGIDDGRRPPARWIGTVSAIAVVAALVGGGLVLAGTSRSDGDTTSPDAPCASGRDLIATTVDTYRRDDRFFDGFLSVAVTGAEATDATWANDPMQVVSQPSISPDGRFVAVRWADGNYESAGPSSESIWVVHLGSGSARPLTFGVNDSSPAFSPDGTEIAYLHHVSFEDPAEVRVVPANGGPHRTVAEVPIDFSYDPELAWLPDGSIVVSATADRNTTITVVPTSGEPRVVTTLSSLATSATVVPGGDELLVLARTSTLSPQKLVAVDLTDGSTRTIGGDSGSVHWSLDGQRLYIADPSRTGPPTIRRARYDGSTIEATGDTVSTQASDEFVVGPCVVPQDPSSPEAQGVNDQPLVGTEWRLGPDSLVATETEVAGCTAPDCRGVTVEIACISVTGALRGTQVTDTETVVAEPNPECPNPEWWSDNTIHSVEVRGDLLRIGLFNERFGPSGDYLFGAAYVDEPPEPIAPPDVDGPAIEAVTTPTSTTVAAPPPADCDLVHSWGDRLAASSVAFEYDWAEEPGIVADNSDLVVTGHLFDTAVDRFDGHVDGGASPLLYRMVVDEVLVGRSNDDPTPGSMIEVTLLSRTDGGRPGPPALGEWGRTGAAPGRPAVPPGEGVPVVAFLDIPDGALEGEWTVTRPTGLAVGCPGRPMTGLIGTGVGWDDLPDIDALVEVVRSN